MADPTNVVNPGLTNVADEAYDGLAAQVPDFKTVPVIASPNNKIEEGGNKRPFVVDQEITVGPSTNPGPLVPADASGNTKTTKIDQEISVGPSTNAGPITQGGDFKPGNSDIRDKSGDRIADQVYGTGTPKNVFV